MTDVEQLLREYIEEHKASGAADPQSYLRRLEGDDRSELAALIDAYLARAPRRAWDPEAFERSGMAPFVDSVARSLQGSAGLWPSLLPRLRNRVRITRADLVAQLAERLGAQAKRDKVALYYHQMEQGLLPSDGVSDQVLEALGKIVGESRDALRRAGEAVGDAPLPGGGPIAEQAFARSTRASAADAPPGAPAASLEHAADEWDEVDRLFRGG